MSQPLEVTWERWDMRAYFQASRNGQPYAEVFLGRTERWWCCIDGIVEPVPFTKLTDAQRFVKDMALFSIVCEPCS